MSSVPFHIVIEMMKLMWY